MNTDWTILGEASCRWVPTQEAHVSHAGGTTSGYARPEPSRRHTLLPSGPRPALVSGAVPNLREAG